MMTCNQGLHNHVSVSMGVMYIIINFMVVKKFFFKTLFNVKIFLVDTRQRTQKEHSTIYSMIFIVLFFIYLFYYFTQV